VAVVSRGFDGLALEPPADGAWLINDVPACRFLAAAWLKRVVCGLG
jgi:hypothetical protein